MISNKGVLAMKKAVVILVAIMLIVSSCTSMPSELEMAEDEEKLPGTEDNENFDNLDDSEVEIVDGESIPVISLNRTIANADFVALEDEKLVFEYVPEEEGQVIQLIDSEGWEWTISFPKFALLSNTQVTFTPIYNIQLDSMPDLNKEGRLYIFYE